MKNKFVSLLAIILGIIIIAFPMIGVIGTSSLIGLSVLLISIYLLVAGVAIIDYNKFNFYDNITSETSSENMTAPEENNLTQEECEEMVNDYLEDTNCSISSVDENDGVYTFHIETQDGQSAGVITVDSQTGEMNTEEFEIPEESDEDMYSDLNAYDMESFDYDMESFDF